MKYIVALSVLLATALAVPTGKGGKEDEKTCDSHQVVACSGNGSGGFLTLGNIAPGLLGDYCSAGDVYCCSTGEVKQVCHDSS